MRRLLPLLFFVPSFTFAHTIAYLTDLEGSQAKLFAFYGKSAAFAKGRDGKYHLNPGWTFVYGGDAPDRYFGSMLVVKELVRLKSETPDRVILIAGNRDTNKVRLKRELTGANRTPEELKRILKETMGSPDAFELRRKELGGVSDQLVLESYLDEPEFERMQREMKLAWRIGDTLFVHGGITPENFGHVPGAGERYDDVNEWIAALNLWYSVSLVHDPEGLVAYQMPPKGSKVKQDSVIYGRLVDENGMPVLPPDWIIEKLIAQGIHRIVYGHTPCGDVPVVLRNAAGTFEIVNGDNSRSADEHNASIIDIVGKRLNLKARVKLAAGWADAEASTEIGKPSPYGRRLEDGAIVVGKSMDHPISFHMKDYVVTNHVVCSGILSVLGNDGAH